MKRSRLTEEQIVTILAEADRKEETIGVSGERTASPKRRSTTGGSDFAGWVSMRSASIGS